MNTPRPLSGPEIDDATPVTTFDLNGAAVNVAHPAAERLSETLRERCGARDVKIGCNAGDCGACSVLVDGVPYVSCLIATSQAEGRTIETLTGLNNDPLVQRLQGSFLTHGAAQCGICTPGMLVSAAALLRTDDRPSRDNVETALAGVLCRCTGYRAIIDAVCDVAGEVVPDGGVGAPVVRIDGRPKVRGTEVFADDAAPANALETAIIRSPHPRAAFDLSALHALKGTEGVAAILTAADIPGRNVFGVIPPFADQPVFAEKEARFRGEAVAAVVGEPALMAHLNTDALVSWTPLPAATSVPDALSADAATLHEGRHRNVMCTGLVRRGDAAAALARAAVVTEGEFASPFVEHAPIEPEAGYAKVVDGRVEVYASTQAPMMDKESLAPILGMDEDRVRIVPLTCGGGFGTKLDLSVQPFLALAALACDRPVRLTYSRTVSMQSTTKRHPSAIRAKVGATADGKICGFHFEGDFDTGAYASWGPTVANRVPVHASGPYLIADYEARSRGVHTNNPPAGAFRGFGVPQSAIAQEVLFEDLALKLGLDPLDFRRRNVLQNGEPTVCGQVFEQGVGIGACLDALKIPFEDARTEAEVFNRDAQADSSPLRRGVGVASGWYGCGNTSIPNPSTIKAGITGTGAIVLHQGASDIGQGANTVIGQIFCTALGVPLSAISLVGPDTDVTPDAGKTSASRQTFVSGNAARLSGEALRAQLLRLANAGPDAEIVAGPNGLAVNDAGRRQIIDLSAHITDSEGYALTVAETYDPPTLPLDENGQGVPYAVFGYAAHVAVVEVDLALGTVKPQRFVAAHDVGRAINPVLVRGQVAGGIAQGLGMALMEEYIPGRTENLHDYLIPTIGDVPEIDTIIVEEADAHGPYGAKGLGEHVLIPTTPALLNAIRHATGVRLTEVPATPSRVRAAILAQGKAGPFTDSSEDGG